MRRECSAAEATIHMILIWWYDLLANEHRSPNWLTVNVSGAFLEETVEHERFDRITRLLGQLTSRRKGLAGFAVAGLAALEVARLDEGGVAAKPAAERCVPNGQRCSQGQGRDGNTCPLCCSRYVTRKPGAKYRRCTCRPDGMECRNSSQCCNGVCSDRVCGAVVACTDLNGACVAGTTTCCDGLGCYNARNQASSTRGKNRAPANTECVKSYGAACSSAQECRLETICDVQLGGGPGTICCVQNGDPATTASNCCSNLLSSGVCTPP